MNNVNKKQKDYEAHYLLPHRDGHVDERTPATYAMANEEGEGTHPPSDTSPYREASARMLKVLTTSLGILLDSKANPETKRQVYALILALGLDNMIDGMTPAQVSRHVGIKRSTLHRMVKSYKATLGLDL